MLKELLSRDIVGSAKSTSSLYYNCLNDYGILHLDIYDGYIYTRVYVRTHAHKLRYTYLLTNRKRITKLIRKEEVLHVNGAN